MVSEASKKKQARQRSADAKASASVASTVSNSKQGMGDNRGYNSSQTGNAQSVPNTTKTPTKTIQERNWDAIKSPNSTMNQNRESEKQQALSRGVGGGRNFTVNLSDRISVNDARNAQKSTKIERRTKQIQDYLNEQNKQKTD